MVSASDDINQNRRGLVNIRRVIFICIDPGTVNGCNFISATKDALNLPDEWEFGCNPLSYWHVARLGWRDCKWFFNTTLQQIRYCIQIQ